MNPGEVWLYGDTRMYFATVLTLGPGRDRSRYRIAILDTNMAEWQGILGTERDWYVLNSEGQPTSDWRRLL